MWAVVSHKKKDSQTTLEKVWVFDTEEKAIKELELIWQDAFNSALIDVDFIEGEQNFHEDYYAQLVWENDVFMTFEAIEVSANSIT